MPYLTAKCTKTRLKILQTLISGDKYGLIFSLCIILSFI